MVCWLFCVAVTTAVCAPIESGNAVPEAWTAPPSTCIPQPSVPGSSARLAAAVQEKFAFGAPPTAYVAPSTGLTTDTDGLGATTV